MDSEQSREKSSPVALPEEITAPLAKPHNAMEFSGIAPTCRTATEIDADIEAGRAEWDVSLSLIQTPLASLPLLSFAHFERGVRD